MSPLIGVIDSSKAKPIESFDSIATLNPASVTTITFSSIPSTYKHLQLRFNLFFASSSVVLGYRLNGDTGTNYAWHTLNAVGGTPTGSGSTAQSSMRILPSTSWATGQAVVGTTDLFEYTNTGMNKVMKTFAGGDVGGGGGICFDSGLWVSTTAVNSITLFTSGTLMGGRVALYGIKG